MRKALTAFAMACLLAHTASAAVVERIVAVVGDRPILLTELRQRARPFIIQASANAKTPAEMAAAESEILRDVLKRVIDEMLIEQAADKARVQVTSEELDGAILNIAGREKLTPKELFDNVRRQGLTEQDYREELRRQILQGKMIQLRVRSRVRVTEDDARTVYGTWSNELAKQSPVEIRLIALRLLAGGTPEQNRAREVLASDIARRARSGEDFCKLVEAYTDDLETRGSCGSRGPQPTTSLMPALKEAVSSLEPGQVSEPVAVGTEAIVVIQMASRSKIPKFDEVKERMMNMASEEALRRQSAAWIGEIKKGVYIDVRL